MLERINSCYIRLLLLRESRDWYILSVFILPFFALVGAILAAVIIYLLAWKDGVSSTRLILVGIAVAAGFGAVSLIFSMKMTSNDFRFATIWLAGKSMGYRLEIRIKCTSMDGYFLTACYK